MRELTPGPMTVLEWLRRPPRKRSTKTLQEELAKLHAVIELSPPTEQLGIPPERVRAYARRMRRRRPIHCMHEDLSGECQSREWRQAWDMFDQLRQTMPAEAPLLISVREDVRPRVSQLRAQSCITEAIWVLDDRISGADVVANAVRDACHDELLEQLTLALATNNGTSTAAASQQASRLLNSEAGLRKISSNVLDSRASAPASRPPPPQVEEAFDESGDFLEELGLSKDAVARGPGVPQED